MRAAGAGSAGSGCCLSLPPGRCSRRHPAPLPPPAWGAHGLRGPRCEQASTSVLYQALHIRLLSGRLGAGVVAVDVGLGWLLWRWGSFSEGGGAGQEGPGKEKAM